MALLLRIHTSILCTKIHSWSSWLDGFPALGKWLLSTQQQHMWDSFPLPHVDDILADCRKGKIFAKMDMTNSFQRWVHPDDIHLTTVRTPWGLYEWTIMPQGGFSAPTTHQHQCCMTNALREHIGKICHVYLDDIIIWLQTMEEHEQNCTTILLSLQKASIYCNQVKSNLLTTELGFLRHIIWGTSVKPNPCKTDHIVSWPQPMTATNIRGF